MTTKTPVAHLVGGASQLHLAVAQSGASGPGSPAAHFVVDPDGSLHLAMASQIWEVVKDAAATGTRLSTAGNFVRVNLSGIDRWDISVSQMLAAYADQHPCTP